jgi:hypothetical protein
VSSLTLLFFLIVPTHFLTSPHISSTASGWNPMYMPAGQLYDIWGSNASDVFVVGTAGAAWHYDGTYWSSMDSGTDAELRGVWGNSSSDVFAVGLYGTILHYDGLQWSLMESGTDWHLFDVWGNSVSDVFAVGSSGTIYFRFK